MSPQEISWMQTTNEELRKENQKLQSELSAAAIKEKELRALIAYLNKLGVKPENMTP